MVELNIGDVIYVDRGLYKHYGVYIGEKKVVHFASDDENETDATRADIRQTTLEDFAKGCEVEVDNSQEPCFPPSEIAQRAKSQIGKHLGKYNLVFNNCENFATWCKTGKSHSKQVEEVGATVLTATTAVLGAPLGAVATTIFAAIASAMFDGGGNEDEKENKIYDTVSLNDIVPFFKRKACFESLRKNKDLKAIIVKKIEDETNLIHIAGAVFNQACGTVEDAFGVLDIKAKNMDEVLANNFGSKDMILLS